MTLVYAAFAVLAVLVGILVYTTLVFNLIKAGAIVALIVLGLGLEVHYRSKLGAPIEGYPDDKALYVAHQVQGVHILIWVWDETLNNRLYMIPYDQATAEQLEAAGEAGSEQSVEFIESEGDNGSTEVSVEVDDWSGDRTEETKEQ
jgi:uncharacterized membrane protein YqiK